jgi:hypothetical protein
MPKASSYSTRSRGVANDSEPASAVLATECDFEYRGKPRRSDTTLGPLTSRRAIVAGALPRRGSERSTDEFELIRGRL